MVVCYLFILDSVIVTINGDYFLCGSDLLTTLTALTVPYLKSFPLTRTVKTLELVPCKLVSELTTLLTRYTWGPLVHVHPQCRPRPSSLSYLVTVFRPHSPLLTRPDSYRPTPVSPGYYSPNILCHSLTPK